MNSFFWLFKSFNAKDYETEDEVIEYNDDLSDRSLFLRSIDIIDILKDNLLIYLLPNLFGVEIEEFQDFEDSYESVDSTESHKNIQSECIQQ